MELIEYEKPLAIEEHIFQVNPDLLDKWFDLENEMWTKPLSKMPGFVSKEIWINSNVPGEVTVITFWSDIKLWKNIDLNWLIENEKKFMDLIGEDNVRMVRAGHEENQRFKVRECR